MTPADERAVQRLLDLVGDHAERLERAIATALRRGRTATADRTYDLASELRLALEDAGRALGARFHVRASSRLRAMLPP